MQDFAGFVLTLRDCLFHCGQDCLGGSQVFLAGWEKEFYLMIPPSLPLFLPPSLPPSLPLPPSPSLPPSPLYSRYSHDGQLFSITNDERTISFLVNDGMFNSSRAMTCVRLVNENDRPELFTGANDTVDTMVMYEEGQQEPLLLAPQLEIRGMYIVV